MKKELLSQQEHQQVAKHALHPIYLFVNTAQLLDWPYGHTVEFKFDYLVNLPHFILGFAAMFGSPIGGLLYSVEQGSSFWTGPLSVR